MQGNRLSYDGYEIVFEEDFDSLELNRDYWNVELHEPGWVNEEWQCYVDSPENIRIEDGKLLLIPVRTKEADGKESYTSGRVNTMGKREFLYGIFEARLKVPRGRGYLPAFWLLAHEDTTFGPWPVCGEIDIMEVCGDKTSVGYGTIHYGLPHEQYQGIIELNEGDFSEEFHDFALLWEPGQMRWYLDGVMFHEAHEWSCSMDGIHRQPFPAPFDHKMYIILNLAVGGSWVGYPDESTEFEHATFEVDYVKVYQKRK